MGGRGIRDGAFDDKHERRIELAVGRLVEGLHELLATQ